jgi:AcrR family transcriptional regulator
MTAAQQDSARKRQLLDAAYDYVIEHGLTELSLRPLAEAIGSSPRVLLFLFGSKDGLVQALLAGLALMNWPCWLMWKPATD